MVGLPCTVWEMQCQSLCWDQPVPVLDALLAACGHAGRVGVWEAGAGQCRHVLEGPNGAIEWLDWHPRGDLILAGSEDFTTWLWNAQTGAFMAVGPPFPLPRSSAAAALVCVE
jgi:WD40 repeat protein